MSALDKIAFHRGRRDEVPNQELARELARGKDAEGIAEIAAHLADRNRSIASDCLKVLYEIGYLEPSLIAPHTGDLLALLDSRNNRMVWGAMIGLAAVAPLRPGEIWKRIETVAEKTEKGTVITLVWGIRVMARVAAARRQYASKLAPILLRHLATCNPRDVPTHLESMLDLAAARGVEEFLSAAHAREGGMTPSQRARLRKVERKLKNSGRPAPAHV